MWNKRAKYAGLAIFALAIVCVVDRRVHDVPRRDAQQPRRLARARRLRAARARRLHPPPPRAHPQAPVPPALRLGRRRRRLPRRDGRPREAREAAQAHRQRRTATPSSTRPPPRPSTRACSTARSSRPTRTARSATPTPSTSGSAPPTASPRSTTRSTERASSSWPTSVGRERTKWCSGCHDPVVLFTGQMGAATQAAFSYDSWEAQQGLTCMSCHSIAEVKDAEGNGALRHRGVQAVSRSPSRDNEALRARQPAAHPHGAFAPPQDVHEALHAHARVLLDLPQGRADSGAERLPLAARPEPLRHLVRLGRLGARGALLLRPAAGRRPAATATCRPTARTSSATGTASCTTTSSPPRTPPCPSSARTRDTQKHIRRLPAEQGPDGRPLRHPARRRRARSARRRRRRPSVRARRSTSRSSSAPAASVIPYTNGTADSNETWVSLEAAAGGGRFFASGVLDADGRLDAAADRLSTLVIDEDGGHMDRRQPQDIRVPLYNNGIGPGAARVVHYRVHGPGGREGRDHAVGRHALPEVLAATTRRSRSARRTRRCR